MGCTHGVPDWQTMVAFSVEPSFQIIVTVDPFGNEVMPLEIRYIPTKPNMPA
jgi:hypothetical protein